MIQTNPHLHPERAKQILQNQIWRRGEGFFYCKTVGQCLEHIEVAEIVRSLEMHGINWSSGTDRSNNVTIMVRNEDWPWLVALGVTDRLAELDRQINSGKTLHYL